ncbi:MAG: FAD:protein FMN transferase [Patescibacteria group bacterium]|nr:FAD:protein FMN transferase [Patescibacteria group bacterium]MDE1946216.1 FAD:protein FMN transferase [Patescibacteria group bacterium]
MKATRTIMGMPVTIDVADPRATGADLEKIFAYFVSVDEQFSPFKKTSELSRINAGEITEKEYSSAMKEVLRLCEELRRLTNGYFNIKKRDGTIDTSGLVKGWAIKHAADMLAKAGFRNFYVNAGSDIQVAGVNEKGKPWAIGIKDPFDPAGERIVKVVHLAHGEGIATSGTYLRGQHIWNPHDEAEKPIADIVSLTVIGPNIYEADRFATPAFAMGKKGISFIENIDGLEGYMIDVNGLATFTSGFEKYLQ